MNFKSFWYIAAESRDLKDKAIGRMILDESIVIFRDESGQPVALRDKCLHRAAPLSKGSVRLGQLRCGYHGWTYDRAGAVVDVPSLGPNSVHQPSCKQASYRTLEKDGYVYISLAEGAPALEEPYSIPHYRDKGWEHIRLVNIFKNNVTNCAENFVDIPHTAYVHDKIFRSRKNKILKANIQRKSGEVNVVYENETSNLGLFTWFLNPTGRTISHSDHFYMPNVTCVKYAFGPKKRFIIMSQSIPVTQKETCVYTDLIYDYGIWNFTARYLIKKQAQKIIDQDMEILNLQMKVIEKYGSDFKNTPADMIHVFIESIRNEIKNGKDPRLLEEKQYECEFYV